MRIKAKTFFLKITFFFLKKQGNVVACFIMVGLAYLGVVSWLAIYETSQKHPSSFYSTEPLLPLATPSKSKVLEKPVPEKRFSTISSKRKYQRFIEGIKRRSDNKYTSSLRKKYNPKKRYSDSLISSLEFTPPEKIKATMEASEYEQEYRNERKEREKDKSRELEQELLRIYEDYKISTLPRPGGKSPPKHLPWIPGGLEK